MPEIYPPYIFGMHDRGGEHLMLSMGKSYLVFKEVDTLKEIERKLDAISAEKLQEVAQEILNPSRLNTLIYE